MVEKRELDLDESHHKRPRLDKEDTSQADQEREVGITAFASPNLPGFRCVVKQRYTDFLVNEIGLDGKVLHLQSLPDVKQRRERHPKRQNGNEERNGNAQRQVSDPSNAAFDQPVDTEPTADDAFPSKVEPRISDEDMTALREIFGEACSKIVELYTAVLSHPDRKPKDHPQVRSGSIAEKPKRTQAHVIIRQVFQSKLESSTLANEDNVILIKAAPPKGASGARVEGRANGPDGAIQKGKVGWHDLGGEFLHFTLYKENKDTMEVLSFIASQLKIPAKSFEFAGTKDRKGVTVQRISVFRILAHKIASLNADARGWTASDFEYKPYGLSLGDLGGNEFLLTLRDCSVDGVGNEQQLDAVRKAVHEAAEAFRTTGFINYYGLQRFGSFSIGTHAIGMKMLQGDLEGAVNSILSFEPSILTASEDEQTKIPRDDIARAQAIHHWRKTGNPPHDMPRRFLAELSMIRFLSKKDRSGKSLNASDYQGALISIMRNLRLMYVHAYQSLVWNLVAGKRWELHGPKVVEGDLVIIGKKDHVGEQVKDEVDENGQPVFHPTAEDSAPSTNTDFTRARPLSKVEAESGRYDIFDVVLPLPGFDVIYPKNELGQFYVDFMASKRGGGLDPHNMRRTFKDISLSGGYRKMMSRPGPGFEAKVQEYADENEQLVETDKEKLHKAAENGNAVKAGAPKAQENGEAKKVAVILKFQLGSSQYATMALRELTKGGATSYVPEFSASR